MRDKTDAELHELGWRWALRSPSGELLAITTCDEDVGEWIKECKHDYMIVPLCKGTVPRKIVIPLR